MPNSLRLMTRLISEPVCDSPFESLLWATRLDRSVSGLVTPWNVKSPVKLYCWSLTLWADVFLKVISGNFSTSRNAEALISLLSSETPVFKVSVLISSLTVDSCGASRSIDTLPETPPQKQPSMLVVHKRRTLNSTEEFSGLISYVSETAATVLVIVHDSNSAEKIDFFMELPPPRAKPRYCTESVRGRKRGRAF